jgi:hypothetical protein
LASNEKAGRPLWSLGFFIILSAGTAHAMNHNVLHRTPLDTAGSRAAGLERLPFAEGLFRTKAATAALESRDIESPFEFDDLVGSFVAEVPAGGEAELSVKVRLEDGWTDWFSLGRLGPDGWSSPAAAPAASDAPAVVDVDTLKLKKKASAFRYRLKLKAGRKPVRLRSVAVAVSDAESPAAPSAFVSGPWVRDLALSPRSQGDAQEKYKHDICSPTSLAMVLEHWGRKKDLEAVALAAQDRGSMLFGNWPANVAYAGTLGLEGRVARLESLADVEAEIALGRPVVVRVILSGGRAAERPDQEDPRPRHGRRRLHCRGRRHRLRSRGKGRKACAASMPDPRSTRSGAGASAASPT